MEFRKGSHEHRPDRRICPACQRLCGTKMECPHCRKRTAARIQINWYIDGKRYRELSSCWREKDAAEVLQRKEADYWRQQELGVQREIGGSLREAADAFSAAQAEHSVNYRKQIATSLSALAAGLGWDRPVQEISPGELVQFKEDGLTVLSRTTVRSYMLVLRRFFNYLHDEGWIRHSPAAKVKLPKATARKDHLRPAEVGPVLDAFWRIAPELGAIPTVIALGGWRKGEVINLRRPDVNLVERWTYVLDFEGDELTEAWSPKTESSVRAVPLHPLVVRALERTKLVIRPDGSQSPWMFPVIDPRKRKRLPERQGWRQPVCGDRRSSGTKFIGSKLRAAMQAAGIERSITLHGLRRTFAVLLQEAGAPDSVIRQALGHGERGVTEFNYLPRRDEMVMRWVDRIAVEIPALEGSPTPSGELVNQSREEGDGRSATIHSPQSATSSVANRPPYLRLVK